MRLITPRLKFKRRSIVHLCRSSSLKTKIAKTDAGSFDIFMLDQHSRPNGLAMQRPYGQNAAVYRTVGPEFSVTMGVLGIGLSRSKFLLARQFEAAKGLSRQSCNGERLQSRHRAFRSRSRHDSPPERSPEKPLVVERDKIESLVTSHTEHRSPVQAADDFNRKIVIVLAKMCVL